MSNTRYINLKPTNFGYSELKILNCCYECDNLCFDNEKFPYCKDNFMKQIAVGYATKGDVVMFPEFCKLKEIETDKGEAIE